MDTAHARRAVLFPLRRRPLGFGGRYFSWTCSPHLGSRYWASRSDLYVGEVQRNLRPLCDQSRGFAGKSFKAHQLAKRFTYLQLTCPAAAVTAPSACAASKMSTRSSVKPAGR